MRRIGLISILVLASFSGYSQASGYMGKKFLITGEVSFLNALFNPNHNMNKGLNKFSFNVRSTTDLDYVIARNGTIGLTFDVFVTGLNYKWNTTEFTDWLVPGINTDFENARISGYGYGINYKIFRNPSKSGIAPIGSYVKFDLMLLDARVKPYSKSNDVVFGYTEQFYTPAFSITLGRQRILWDFLILRSGIQIGFVPTGISPYLQNLDSKGIERATQEQDLRAHVEARLFSYYLLNVNFGVGFLLPFRKNYKSSN